MLGVMLKARLNLPTPDLAQSQTTRRALHHAYGFAQTLGVHGDQSRTGLETSDQYPNTPIGFQNHAHAKYHQITDSEFQGIVVVAS